MTKHEGWGWRPGRGWGGLHDKPGVAHVTAFGNTLHVTGEDQDELQRAIEPLRHDPALRWTEARPGLEDVFIHLMKGQGEK